MERRGKECGAVKRLEIIKFLLAEMERELEYNKEHAREALIARRKAKANGGNEWYYRNYMPDGYSHEPKQAVIAQNAKTIRRLLLSYYKAQN